MGYRRPAHLAWCSHADTAVRHCFHALPPTRPAPLTALPPSLLTLQLNLRGSAGQSFASFLVNGMVVRLVGEANDYVGKGMAGGDVTIVPPPGRLASHSAWV